jgi:hypothetical protein
MVLPWRWRWTTPADDGTAPMTMIMKRFAIHTQLPLCDFVVLCKRKRGKRRAFVFRLLGRLLSFLASGTQNPRALTQRPFAVCFVLSVRTTTNRLKFNALQSASSNVLCELLLMMGDRFVLLWLQLC